MFDRPTRGGRSRCRTMPDARRRDGSMSAKGRKGDRGYGTPGVVVVIVETGRPPARQAYPTVDVRHRDVACDAPRSSRTGRRRACNRKTPERRREPDTANEGQQIRLPRIRRDRGCKAGCVAALKRASRPTPCGKAEDGIRGGPQRMSRHAGLGRQRLRGDTDRVEWVAGPGRGGRRDAG